MLSSTPLPGTSKTRALSISVQTRARESGRNSSVVSHAFCQSTGSVGRAGFEDLFEAWIEAVTARDPDGVARLHLPGGIFHLTRAGTARGPDSIRSSCADWLCQDGVEASVALLETRFYDTAHLATGNGRFTLAHRPSSNGRNGKLDTGRLLLVAEEDRDRWGLRFSGLFSDTYLDELATFRT